MNNQDSQNDDSGIEDLTLDSECQALDFHAENFARRILKNFGGVTCDSWPLDGLYCEGLSQSEDAAPVIILDDKYAVLSWAAQKISASPTGLAMLEEAKSQGWSLALEPLEGSKNNREKGPDFHLNVPEKMIVLDDQALATATLGSSEYFKNVLLVSLIRALRDVWQEKRHGAFDERYGPERVLMLERIRAADLDVISVLTAWELRSENHTSLWRHLIGSEDGDLAMRFSGYLERDPSSAFNGKALGAAFKQWFRDESRVNACDHETLDYLDNVVYLNEDSFCFGDEKLTPVALEVLSCLPDKTAYLQGRGGEMLADPLYAGLSDEINQAHFSQIIYDMRVTRVQNVPFRDVYLAERIFPNGEFTPETKDTIH